MRPDRYKPIAKCIIPLWMIFLGLLLYPEADHSQCEVLTHLEIKLEQSMQAKIYCRHGKKFYLY